MFERFTAEARSLVVRAQQEARALDHGWVGCEHLLLAALSARQTAGVEPLRRLGVTAETATAELHEVLGTARAGLGRRDADALSALGIDIEEVRSRVEAAFGPGAFDAAPRPHRHRLWDRRRFRVKTGHIPFTDRAKRALTLSLREAIALGDKHIGVEHILLGLLDPKGNLATEIMRRLGVPPDRIRTAVLADLGKAA